MVLAACGADRKTAADGMRAIFDESGGAVGWRLPISPATVSRILPRFGPLGHRITGGRRGQSNQQPGRGNFDTVARLDCRGPSCASPSFDPQFLHELLCRVGNAAGSVLLAMFPHPHINSGRVCFDLHPIGRRGVCRAYIAG